MSGINQDGESVIALDFHIVLIVVAITFQMVNQIF